MKAQPKPIAEWLADYTASQVASAIGVNQTTVSRWIRGAAVPRGDQLQALARFLKISANRILLDKATVAQPAATDKVVSKKVLCDVRGAA